MNYNNQYFFNRDTDQEGYEKYINEYSDILNIRTLPLFLTHFKNLYNHKNYQYYLKYILSLIKRWIFINEFLSYSFLNKLKNIIHWYNLYEKLNNVELSYIQEIESIVFNKNRNLKNITTEFTLFKEKSFIFSRKEEIFYLFENVDIFISNDQRYENIITLITLNHIVFLYQSNFIKIKFDDIYTYKLNLPNEIIIYYKDKVIKIKSSEIKNIYVSFERVFYGKKTKRKNR